MVLRCGGGWAEMGRSGAIWWSRDGSASGQGRSSAAAIASSVRHGPYSLQLGAVRPLRPPVVLCDDLSRTGRVWDASYCCTAMGMVVGSPVTLSTTEA